MARVWLVLAIGCAGEKDDGTGIDPIDTDTGTVPEPTGDTGGDVPLSPDLVVTDDNTYSVSVAWDIATTDVRAGWDVLVSWSALETDVWGDPIDEATIPVFALLEILYPASEVAEHLAVEDFGSDLLSVWEADVTGDVFVNLSDLSYETTPFDPTAFLLDEPDKTWLAVLADRDGDRLDIRAALALEADDTSAVTSVDIDDTASQVTWSGALDGTALVTTGGQALYALDWSALESDVFGKPYDPYAGDVLFVGRFDGRAPADLAGDLAALESAASAWYTMDVARNTEARLDLAKDGSGAFFSGFTAGDTWVVGVSCGTCLGRFPLWASVVEVR